MLCSASPVEKVLALGVGSARGLRRPHPAQRLQRPSRSGRRRPRSAERRQPRETGMRDERQRIAAEAVHRCDARLRSDRRGENGGEREARREGDEKEKKEEKDRWKKGSDRKLPGTCGRAERR